MVFKSAPNMGAVEVPMPQGRRTFAEVYSKLKGHCWLKIYQISFRHLCKRCRDDNTMVISGPCTKGSPDKVA